MPKKKTWFAFGLTALMWFLLFQNPPLGPQPLGWQTNGLLARLTTTQIEEAKRLAAEWLKAHKKS